MGAERAPDDCQVLCLSDWKWGGTRNHDKGEGASSSKMEGWYFIF